MHKLWNKAQSVTKWVGDSVTKLQAATEQSYMLPDTQPGPLTGHCAACNGTVAHAIGCPLQYTRQPRKARYSA